MDTKNLLHAKNVRRMIAKRSLALSNEREQRCGLTKTKMEK
jgi:hypothetical protein